MIFYIKRTIKGLLCEIIYKIITQTKIKKLYTNDYVSPKNARDLIALFFPEISVGVVRCSCRCRCRSKWCSILQPCKQSNCLRIGYPCSTRTPSWPCCRTCSNCCFTSKPHRLPQPTGCPFNYCSSRARSSSPCCPSTFAFDCLLISTCTQCSIGTCLVKKKKLSQPK